MTNVVKSPPVSPSGARTWPLSVAAYHALGDLGLIPEDSELLYGQIFHKMAKSPYHCFLAQVVQEALSPELRNGLLLRAEKPITCADSEPEPDIAIASGSLADYRHQHPQSAELVVEICVTSHEYDRSKLRAYATASVKECWLVLGPEMRVEVYRLPINGQYTQRIEMGINETLTCAALPGFSLPLKSLFAA